MILLEECGERCGCGEDSDIKISIPLFIIGFTVFGFLISYNFVPNYFRLLNADGTLEIKNISTYNKTFNYSGENYTVTSLFFKNNDYG